MNRMDEIFSKCQKKISSRFAAVTQLHSACLSNLEGEEGKDRDDLVGWEMEKIDSILASTLKVSKEDGPCLVEIAERYPNEEYLTK